ncbi:hypothetical protein [Asticcacaulis sp. EMRT-3]|uniref:hypothetical protein n=1 Tax=Asticcacaulis sp. EMRT-3 TaxID=3040349 RepID=UPI0024AF8FAF|nr:hypothetical protein [Asticcacaulis sp. EMRT-3]MDI7774613.1 hypothetical protein [Asticcacaulis sp. EMRT-3]
MAAILFHLIDNNTGEAVYASDSFRFLDVPLPNHIIHDDVLRERYGAPAIVDRVENAPDGSIHVYIDALEEQRNADAIDTDQAYRRS